LRAGYAGKAGIHHALRGLCCAVLTNGFAYAAQIATSGVGAYAKGIAPQGALPPQNPINESKKHFLRLIYSTPKQADI
jgi:hypothetical protein